MHFLSPLALSFRKLKFTFSRIVWVGSPRLLSCEISTWHPTEFWKDLVLSAGGQAYSARLCFQGEGTRTRHFLCFHSQQTVVCDACDDRGIWVHLLWVWLSKNFPFSILPQRRRQSWSQIAFLGLISREHLCFFSRSSNPFHVVLAPSFPDYCKNHFFIHFSEPLVAPPTRTAKRCPLLCLLRFLSGHLSPFPCLLQRTQSYCSLLASKQLVSSPL